MENLFQNLSGLDYVILCIVILLIFRGFLHGCSGEIGRLAGALSAAAMLFFGLRPVSIWTANLGILDSSAFGKQLLLFICMLVSCVSVWLLVSHLLANVIRLAIHQPFDAILGGAIGGVKAVILLCVLCALGMLTPHQSVEAVLAKHSSFIEKLSTWVAPLSSTTN